MTALTGNQYNKEGQNFGLMAAKRASNSTSRDEPTSQARMRKIEVLEKNLLLNDSSSSGGAYVSDEYGTRLALQSLYASFFLDSKVYRRVFVQKYCKNQTRLNFLSLSTGERLAAERSKETSKEAASVVVTSERVSQVVGEVVIPTAATSTGEAPPKRKTKAKAASTSKRKAPSQMKAKKLDDDEIIDLTSPEKHIRKRRNFGKSDADCDFSVTAVAVDPALSGQNDASIYDLARKKAIAISDASDTAEEYSDVMGRFRKNGDIGIKPCDYKALHVHMSTLEQLIMLNASKIQIRKVYQDLKNNLHKHLEYYPAALGFFNEVQKTLDEIVCDVIELDLSKHPSYVKANELALGDIGRHNLIKFFKKAVADFGLTTASGVNFEGYKVISTHLLAFRRLVDMKAPKSVIEFKRQAIENAFSSHLQTFPAAQAFISECRAKIDMILL
jgi:hypothetical protein